MKRPTLTNEDREGMMEYVAHFGAIHDEECPGDDTCSCAEKQKNDGVTAACNYLHNAPAYIAALEADRAVLVAVAKRTLQREKSVVPRDEHGRQERWKRVNAAEEIEQHAVAATDRIAKGMGIKIQE